MAEMEVRTRVAAERGDVLLHPVQGVTFWQSYMLMSVYIAMLC